MPLLSPSPVDHNEVEPDCLGCAWTGSPCSTVCAACGCAWTWIEWYDEPNPQSEACEGGCPCHAWEYVEARAAERREDGLEAAWKAAGYADSMAVWQAEAR